MSGIYVHIPFCKSRCIYCDFFSTTLLELRDSYVRAVCKEIDDRSDFLGDKEIQTIYFGGGTPSQLSAEHISTILNTIHNEFHVSSSPEVTIEMNPDDVTPSYATKIQRLGVNRVSLGVQSFNDSILQFINRRHNASKAIEAVNILQECGFSNISIDLMFGFPHQTLVQCEADIDQALRLRIQHISTYSLMYEEGTRLYDLLQRHKIEEIDEELSLDMYHTIVRRLKDKGYEHYEISNFALPGLRSKHNSSYWNNTEYLGIGAGAHSFNGTTRSWNVNDIKRYIEGTNQGVLVSEQEILTLDQRFNETVMTRLRTSEGIDLNYINQHFGSDYLSYLTKAATPYYNNGMLTNDGQRMRLTEEGIYTSNDIISSLFV